LADARDDAAKVFGRISEAFQTLSDPEQRTQYMNALQKGMGEAEEVAKVQQVIEATIDFQKADVFVRKRDFEKAEKFARRAYEGDPEQPDHLALFAWVLANQPARYDKRDFAESMTLLDQAIKMHARCERAYHYRAVLNKLLGKDAQAVRDFRTAADINPRNIDAVREVRIASMRGTSQAPEPNPERTRTRRGDDKKKDSTDDGKPIKWGQDSVGDIVGKLLKRK
jgi:tetratricopeptide (TPR) repeat protein